MAVTAEQLEQVRKGVIEREGAADPESLRRLIRVEINPVEHFTYEAHSPAEPQLKMMIDEKDQWPVIQETLSQEQFVVFKKILNSKKDTVIERNLKKLYQMKGARRILKLEEHLDEEQQKYVGKLMEIAMK